MILLDTNVFVGAIAQDDGLHEKAENALASVTEPILLHEYVYIETLSVLATRHGMDEVAKFLSLVTEQISRGGIEFALSDPEQLRRMTMLFIEQSKGVLSFTDVAILYLSQYYEAMTFDKDLARSIEKQKKDRK